MIVSTCAAVLYLALQPPSITPERIPAESKAVQVELRFKPRPGEQLRYRLNREHIDSGGGGPEHLRTSKSEAEFVLVVTEHTAESIKADLKYERIKLSEGEGDAAFSYDSAEKPTDEPRQIVAKWVKPVLEGTYSVTCDGRGTLLNIEGMPANVFEAMADSPLATEEGKQEIRRLHDLVGAAIVPTLVQLKSGHMTEPLSVIFRPGYDAPPNVAGGESWVSEEAQRRFTAEEPNGRNVTIRFSGVEELQPEGEKTTTAGLIAWSAESGTLVRAESVFRVLRSSVFTPGERSEWKLERLPEPPPPEPRPVTKPT